jgi:hypothetical protein
MKYIALTVIVFVLMMPGVIADDNSTSVSNDNSTYNVTADVENQINSFPTCNPTDTLCHIFQIDLKVGIDHFTNLIGITPPETVVEDQLIANYEREREVVQLQNQEQNGTVALSVAQATYNSLQSDINNDNQSVNSEIGTLQQANPQEDVAALQSVQTSEQSTDNAVNSEQQQIVAQTPTTETSTEVTSPFADIIPTATCEQTGSTETSSSTETTTYSNATTTTTTTESIGNVTVSNITNETSSGMNTIINVIDNLPNTIVNIVDNYSASVENAISQAGLTQTTESTGTPSAIETGTSAIENPTDTSPVNTPESLTNSQPVVGIAGQAPLVQVKNLTAGPVVKNKNSRLVQFAAIMQKKMQEVNASRAATPAKTVASSKTTTRK